MKKRIIVLLLVLLMLLCPLILACEDDEPKKYYKLYLENSDGSHIVWTLASRPETTDGFLYWNNEDGMLRAVSGKIVLEEHVMKERKNDE